jgi:hypothetical protein
MHEHPDFDGKRANRLGQIRAANTGKPAHQAVVL